jgi:hypothetical protein
VENQSPSEPTHSLIVLTYTRSDLIKDRISELTRFYGSRPDVEILVFDNGSTNLEIKLALSNLPGVRVERVDQNLGFGGGWNEAIKRSTGDIVYLISDDVRIYGDFISVIEKRFKGMPIMSGSGDFLKGMLIGHQMIKHKAGWNEFKGMEPISYLMGHFLVIAREVWDELGGFDSKTFHPNDMEDVDLSYRAQNYSGIELIEISDLPIEHLVAGTLGYSPERFEHTVKMRARFASKHGLINEPERP